MQGQQKNEKTEEFDATLDGEMNQQQTYIDKRDQSPINATEEDLSMSKPERNQRKVRELNYIDQENIIDGEQSNNQSKMASVSRNFEKKMTNERTVRGGLDFYRDRADRLESYQRKKHGHLQNIISQDKSKVKDKTKDFIKAQLQKRLYKDQGDRLLRKNMDALNVPQQIEEQFRKKAEMYDQMRIMEHEVSEFMNQKLLSIKEDLLSAGQQAKVKRDLLLHIEIDHNGPESGWGVKIEGKIQNALKEQAVLRPGSNMHFLSFFERVSVQFPGNENLYREVQWTKAKNIQGSNIDCIKFSRKYNERAQLPIRCKVILHLDNQPKKFRLSPQLQKVLGIQEETRTKIVGALWQYIKSNRLQESDVGGGGTVDYNQISGQGQQSGRQVINANQELLSIFKGQDKIQFHQIMGRLDEHLFEVEPIEFDLVIDQTKEKRFESCYYQLPVDCFSQAQQKYIDFLVNSNYEQVGDFGQETSFFERMGQVDLNMGVEKHQPLADSKDGYTLKKRERKQNEKIKASIERVKKHYRHMVFYEGFGECQVVKKPKKHHETKQQEASHQPAPQNKSGSYLESLKNRGQSPIKKDPPPRETPPEAPQIQPPTPPAAEVQKQPDVVQEDEHDTTYDAKKLCMSLTNLIVNQNNLLKILLSEQSFQGQCADMYSSTLLGEDLSQIVQTATVGSSSGIMTGNQVHKQLENEIRKATEANASHSAFYKVNQEWLMDEIETYLKENENDLSQRQWEISQKRIQEHQNKLRRDVGAYLEQQQPMPLPNYEEGDAEQVPEELEEEDVQDQEMIMPTEEQEEI